MDVAEWYVGTQAAADCGLLCASLFWELQMDVHNHGHDSTDMADSRLHLLSGSKMQSARPASAPGHHLWAGQS